MLDLMRRLRNSGVEVWVSDEGKLHYKAPPRVLTEDLLAEIRGHKEELISYLSIQRVPRESELPLSYAQERLWFLDQLDHGSGGYNETDAIRISGDLRLEVLEESFTRLVERHETLRTVFQAKEGRPVQVIQAPERFQIPVIDLRDVPGRQREGRARELAAEEARRPFNLGTGPLLRVKVMRLGDADHLLVLNMHHIICDGWSMGVLIRELGENIHALLEGETPILSPLPIQYVDYAVWQRRWLEGGELQRQLGYWKKQLSGAPELLNLPTDCARPAIEGHRGSARIFTLSKELTARLKDLSQEEGVTLFMTLLAALDVLLYRYSGQEDVCVGSPIANRNRTEIEGLIGFFVNTLVLRAQISDEQGFRDFLKEVKRTTLEAYDHQDVPFEKLVEELQPHRQLSYSPLFQVMMVFQNAPAEGAVFEEMEIAPFEIEPGVAKFDLTLNLIEQGGRIEGVMEYNTDLYQSDTIERMIHYYKRILNAVADERDAKLSEIELIDEAEKHRILMEWNDTSAEYPRDKCIHQLFEEQVDKAPDAVAVVYEEEKLTYRELNERANQLARYLQKRGVGPDCLVGICVERSLEMIVGIMGILKAGGAYVPLDPEYPEERIEYMIEDSGIRVVLTQGSLLERLSACKGEKVCLDEHWESMCCESNVNLDMVVEPDNLAYVIYTSGSTGKPKGAMIQHNNIVRLLFNDAFQFQFCSHDVWTMFHSFCFDFSVWEMYGALLYGGTLVIIPKMVARDPSRYLDCLRKEKVTVLNQVPSSFYHLADEELMSAEKELHLRYVIFGGEALSPLRLKAWRAKYSGTRLINMYGITETTVHVTYKEITEMEIGSNVSNIGRPIPTLTTYILDRNLHIAPIGVIGELCVSGDGLGRGYLNRPELTSEIFVANPYLSGQRLYRSGDAARLLSNGEMEYFGRIDQQVKIRGFRVECGEIESVLSQHENIKAAVVAARKDGGEDNRLIAYLVVKDPGQELTSTALRGFLQRKLPDYMIPSAFVPLDAFPLTPSGKIDRKALPAPEGTLGGAAQYVAPRDETEQGLAEIWEAVLGVERVGIYDNFFDLGGHSLLATQIMFQIREFFHVELPLKVLFEAPTIVQMARYCKTGATGYEEGEV